MYIGGIWVCGSGRFRRWVFDLFRCYFRFRSPSFPSIHFHFVEEV